MSRNEYSSSSASDAPLLQSFVDLFAMNGAVNYCLICLRTQNETRLVRNKALKEFTKAMNIEKSWQHHLICFTCERQAIKALNFFKAAKFAAALDTLFVELMYQKKLKKGDLFTNTNFRMLLRKFNIVGAGDNTTAADWERQLQTIRRTTQLSENKALVVDNGGGEGKTKTYKITHDHPSELHGEVTGIAVCRRGNNFLPYLSRKKMIPRKIATYSKRRTVAVKIVTPTNNNSSTSFHSRGVTAGNTKTTTSSNRRGVTAGKTETSTSLNSRGAIASKTEISTSSNSLGVIAGTTGTSTISNSLGVIVDVAGTSTSRNSLGVIADVAGTSTSRNSLGVMAGVPGTSTSSNSQGVIADVAGTSTSRNSLGVIADVAGTSTSSNSLGFIAGVPGTSTSSNSLGVMAGVPGTSTSSNSLGVMAGVPGTSTSSNSLEFIAGVGGTSSSDAYILGLQEPRISEALVIYEDEEDQNDFDMKSTNSPYPTQPILEKLLVKPGSIQTPIVTPLVVPLASLLQKPKEILTGHNVLVSSPNGNYTLHPIAIKEGVTTIPTLNANFFNGQLVYNLPQTQPLLKDLLEAPSQMPVLPILHNNNNILNQNNVSSTSQDSVLPGLESNSNKRKQVETQHDEVQCKKKRLPVKNRDRIDWEDKIPMDVISYIGANDTNLIQNNKTNPNSIQKIRTSTEILENYIKAEVETPYDSATILKKLNSESDINE